MWAKAPVPVVGSAPAASGSGVPHHGGAIAAGALPTAPSGTAITTRRANHLPTLRAKDGPPLSWTGSHDKPPAPRSESPCVLPGDRPRLGGPTGLDGSCQGASENGEAPLSRQFWLNHGLLSLRPIPCSSAKRCAGDAPVMHDECCRCQQRQRSEPTGCLQLLTVPDSTGRGRTPDALAAPSANAISLLVAVCMSLTYIRSTIIGLIR